MSVNIPKHAIVLAAGLGKRMRPLTDTTPKPLIRVAGKPLIDWVLDYLSQSGVVEAVVNISYLGQQIEAHLASRSHPRTQLSREEVPLETGGGIFKALPLLGVDSFISCNSDAICIDGALPVFERLAAAWDDTRMDALLLLHPVATASGYEGAGDFFLEPDGRVKRRRGDENAPYVFTGIQILHPRLFEACPDGAFSLNILYDRSRDAEGVLHRVHAIVHDGAWLHVGDIAGLNSAETYLRHA